MTKSTRIVVGVDGSSSSRSAVAWALRQAQLTAAELDVVTTRVWPASLSGQTYVPADFNPEHDAVGVQEDVVDEVVGSDSDVTVRSVVLEAPPAVGLLQQATHADLLVVGSRGHGAFAGMLLGSVSQHCVIHARCPVVVVHDPPAPAGAA